MSPAARRLLRDAIDARVRELHGRPLRGDPPALCQAFRVVGGSRCDKLSRPGSRFCGIHERANRAT